MRARLPASSGQSARHSARHSGRSASPCFPPIAWPMCRRRLSTRLIDHSRNLAQPTTPVIDRVDRSMCAPTIATFVPPSPASSVVTPWADCAWIAATVTDVLETSRLWERATGSRRCGASRTGRLGQWLQGSGRTARTVSRALSCYRPADCHQTRSIHDDRRTIRRRCALSAGLLPDTNVWARRRRGSSRFEGRNAG